ncbi:MAG TPA: hypothetical protein VNW99_06770 [Cytophagaceae bacterium]|jgi:hypothetical protein|nr:hypothetical protein [Cytophagaceae bacterium]
MSGLLPIGSMMGGTTTITTIVMSPVPILVDSGLLACIAIEFYQMVAGSPYLLSSNNCMKTEICPITHNRFLYFLKQNFSRRRLLLYQQLLGNLQKYLWQAIIQQGYFLPLKY